MPCGSRGGRQAPDSRVRMVYFRAVVNSRVAITTGAWKAAATGHKYITIRQERCGVRKTIVVERSRDGPCFRVRIVEFGITESRVEDSKVSVHTSRDEYLPVR